jgi:hypothetical protein
MMSIARYGGTLLARGVIVLVAVIVAVIVAMLMSLIG